MPAAVDLRKRAPRPKAHALPYALASAEESIFSLRQDLPQVHLTRHATDEERARTPLPFCP